MNDLKKAQIIFLVMALNFFFVFSSHASKQFLDRCFKVFQDNESSKTFKTNENDKTAAWVYAMKSLDFQTMRSLLNNKEVQIDVNAKDKDGKTALMYALDSGHTKFAKELIKNGADINAADSSGRTVLMYASQRGVFSIRKDLYDFFGLLERKYLVIVQELIINEVKNVNAKDKDGNTALIYAAESEYFQILSELIKNGASLTVENEFHMDLWKHVFDIGNSETRKLVIKAIGSELLKIPASIFKGNSFTPSRRGVENSEIYNQGLRRK